MGKNSKLVEVVFKGERRAIRGRMPAWNRSRLHIPEAGPTLIGVDSTNLGAWVQNRSTLMTIALNTGCLL